MNADDHGRRRASGAGNYDIVPYQSTHNTGGTIMGTDPKTSVVNRYLQAWDADNLFIMGASTVSAAAGLQSDRTGGRARLLVGRGDHHEISQEPRPAGAGVIKIKGRTMRHSLPGITAGACLFSRSRRARAGGRRRAWQGAVPGLRRLSHRTARCARPEPQGRGRTQIGGARGFPLLEPDEARQPGLGRSQLARLHQDPQAKVKGNRMPYGGLTDGKDVDDIIAYLKILQ